APADVPAGPARRRGEGQPPPYAGCAAGPSRRPALAPARRRRYTPRRTGAPPQGGRDGGGTGMAEPKLPAVGGAAEARLEQGEVLFYPAAPFALPRGADHDFLLRQEQAPLGHKNISFNPHTRRVSGAVLRGDGQLEQLAELFAAFSAAVSAWLHGALPRYRGGCAPDRASFRPREEATRRLRSPARNALLHVDAFPSRPARGRRTLRVSANITPTEPRIWVPSEPLPRLLARYGE